MLLDDLKARLKAAQERTGGTLRLTISVGDLDGSHDALYVNHWPTDSWDCKAILPAVPTVDALLESVERYAARCLRKPTEAEIARMLGLEA